MPKHADVVVTLIKDMTKPAPHVGFQMSSNIKKNDRLEFWNDDDDPGYFVDFHIEDDAQSGYLFPRDETKAIWVKAASDPKNPMKDCPKKPSTWPQFTPVSVSPDQKVLRVLNLNQHKQVFAFALRFTKDPNAEPDLLYDPIGTNQNGGTSGVSFAVVAGCALVCAALIGSALLLSR
jgi:hypothetical protein